MSAATSRSLLLLRSSVNWLAQAGSNKLVENQEIFQKVFHCDWKLHLGDGRVQEVELDRYDNMGRHSAHFQNLEIGFV